MLGGPQTIPLTPLRGTRTPLAEDFKPPMKGVGPAFRGPRLHPQRRRGLPRKHRLCPVGNTSVSEAHAQRALGATNLTPATPPPDDATAQPGPREERLQPPRRTPGPCSRPCPGSPGPQRVSAPGAKRRFRQRPNADGQTRGPGGGTSGPWASGCRACARWRPLHPEPVKSTVGTSHCQEKNFHFLLTRNEFSEEIRFIATSHAELPAEGLQPSRGDPTSPRPHRGAGDTVSAPETTPGQRFPPGPSLALRPTRGRQGHLVSWLLRGQLLPAPSSSSRNARIMEAWG